ncbi:MAG: beta strand repeat-containing protein [Akkermansiaceae bacterium]
MKTLHYASFKGLRSMAHRLQSSVASAILGMLGIAALPQMLTAQQSITTHTTVTQNFDGMGSSSTAALPAGFRLGLNWSTGTSATTLAYGTSGTGAVTGSSSGGVINWANGVTGSSTDRGLGFLTTGSFTTPTSIIYAFTNNTGATVVSLNLAWDYEKYRSGTRAFNWTFFHGNTATASTAATAGDQAYPVDANNTVISNPPLSVNKTLSLTGLNIPNGTTYYLRWTYTGVGGTSNAQGLGIDNFSIKTTADATQPAITGIATASAFSTTYGTPSAAQTFSVSGVNLTTDLVASAPTGFEVSADGVSYGSTVAFPQTAGSASGSLRIRLAANAAVTGTYNAQNISLSSSGANTVNITTAASGNVVSAKSLTITGLAAQNKNWDGTTSVQVTGTPEYVGLVNSETFAVSGSVSWAFVDANVGTAKPLVRTGSFAAPSTNYTVVQPSFSASIEGLAPPAPTITEIVAGNQQLSVAFSAPANNGGVAITNYEYSLNGGSNWVTPSPASTISPLLILGLTNGVAYDVQLRAVNAIGTGLASATTQATPLAPADPTISVTPNVLGAALSSTYGTASTTQAIVVSGSVLTGDLTVTPPSGLEVSLASTSGFADQINLTATDGSVAATTLYVRLKATAPAGSYNSASIVISGGGATSQNCATTASGNTQATKTLTITGLTASNREYDATTDVSVTGTAEFSGLVNEETFTPSGSVTWAFANKSAGASKSLVRTGDYAAPSANYTVTQPSLSANITVKELTVTGAVVTTRPYNTTTTAGILGATLSGMIGSDVVTLTNDTTGVFAQANVGENIAVTTTMGLAGADAGNYSIVQPTLTGTIVKADQLITFGELGSRSIADPPITLAGVANSTLPVSYASSNPLVASISGNTLTILALGTTTITATQDGNENYNPAIAVERVLVVTPVPLLWTFGSSAPGTDTPTGIPTNSNVSALTRGNNNGTTTLLTNTSTSSLYGGASGSYNAGAAARTGILNTATNGSTYFEFTITPSSGFKGSVTSISFGNRSTTTGPQAYSIRSSADNYATDLYSGVILNNGTWALMSHQNLSLGIGEARTFRIYGHSGTGSAGSGSANWRIDDLRILMTVEEKLTPTITTVPTASAITVGQSLASSTLSGGLASVAGTFSFTTSSTTPAVGTSAQGVIFTPADTLNYKSVTLSVDVITNRATPTITTAPTASAITVGQTLASSTLSGGIASVAGSFAFTSPSTEPTQGTSAQSVTFTPADTTNYNSVILSVNVTANPVVTVDPLMTDASKNAVLSHVAGGAKRLTFTGIPGRVYGIQRSSDLNTWIQINTVTTPENGSVTFDDPSPLQGSGFYRIVYPAADN